MDRPEIREVLSSILGPSHKLIDHPQWVGMQCPLAPWTHAKGSDSSPSAGISVKPEGMSIFNCYVCGKMTFSQFVEEYGDLSGQDFSGLAEEISTNDWLGAPLPEWGRARQAVRQAPLPVLDKAIYLGLYEPAAGHWYLAERGITDETADRLGLLVDPGDSQGDERILFPIMGRNGDLYGFSGRAVEKGVEPKVRDYHGLKKARVLLGAHLVRPDDKFVVLVEGLFDYAFVQQLDYPALASMHARLTDDQIQILLDIGKPVVLMEDNDDAGREGMNYAIEKLSGKLPVSYTTYPVRKDSQGRRLRCQPKDPPTCTAREIDYMIAHASVA